MKRSLGLAALAAALLLGGGALLVSIASLVSGALWVRALRATLLDSALVLAVAVALGFPLGFLAGAGLKLAETALGRLRELSSALPAGLLAAACVAAGSAFYGLALGIGALRGVELASLLSAELARERRRLSLDGHSAARLPVSVYFRRAFPRALGPALISLALTPGWVSAMDAANVFLGTPLLSQRISLGALAARGAAWPLLLVVSITAALYVLARYLDRRFSSALEESEADDVALPLRRRVSLPPPERA